MSVDELRQGAEPGWAEAVRADPGPTVAYFEDLLARHPDSALALYHCARANDYAGNPAAAAPLYERAFAAGLPDPELRRGLTSYGSTLRNLGRPADAVEIGRAHV